MEEKTRVLAQKGDRGMVTWDRWFDHQVAKAGKLPILPQKGLRKDQQNDKYIKNYSQEVYEDFYIKWLLLSYKKHRGVALFREVHFQWWKWTRILWKLDQNSVDFLYKIYNSA